MILIYQLLSIILSPIIDIIFFSRLIRGKEDKKRFKERFGFPSISKSGNKLIWIHAASVGESNSALNFIKKLSKDRPEYQILFTSGTVNSANDLKNKLPNNIIHQFVPIDKFFTARRFIKYWRPDIVIFFESEIWINLINIAHKFGSKITIVNARISNKSFLNWKRFRFHRDIFSKFSLIIAQSNKDQLKFQELSNQKIYHFGNLKEDFTPAKIDQKLLSQFQYLVKDRIVLFAASTHKNEEEKIIKLHQKLKKNINNLLTIIAIRHPNRKNEISNLLTDTSHKFFSIDKDINKNDDFFIIDEIGYMDLFYKISDLSIICGSLLPNIGGHNPYEALKYHNVIISGEFVVNFAENYKKLSQNKVCQMIKNDDELYEKSLKILTDKKYQMEIKNDIKDFISQNNSILDKNLEKFYEILDKND